MQQKVNREMLGIGNFLAILGLLSAHMLPIYHHTNISKVIYYNHMVILHTATTHYTLTHSTQKQFCSDNNIVSKFKGDSK